MIDFLFVSRDAEAILSIPICLVQTEDRMIWHYSKNGIFNVRSTYHVGRTFQSMKVVSKSASSSESHMQELGWKRLWKLNVPPKAKHTLWKFCKNILPTKVLLAKRISTMDEACPRCEAAKETLRHTIFECCSSRKTWQMWNPKFDKILQLSTSSYDLWQRMLETNELEHRNLEEFVMLVWGIWNARNSLIFEGRMTSPEQIQNRVSAYLAAFQTSAVQSRGYDGVSKEPQTRWKAPVEGAYKLSVDGAMENGQTAIAGIGAIIRGSNSKIIATMACPVDRTSNPIFLEALAITKGLTLAHNTRVAGYSMESDCLQLVSRINSGDNDLSEIGHIVQALRQAIKKLNVQVSHMSEGASISQLIIWLNLHVS